MKYILLLFLFLFPLCATEAQSSATRPNVIIIVSDDQGWGDLSIHGNTNLHTPNIDNLARQGASFAHFYVSPVCSPTRAELLTGRYHPRGGVYSTSAGGERLDLDELTIAEVFKNAGYATAAYGKWHNGMQFPYHPNARGFDDFYGFCSGHWGDYFSPQLEHNGKLVRGNGFIIDDLTNRAIRYIENNKDKPFFLYLPYNTPHSPMQVPDRWWNKFKDKELEMLGDDAEEDLAFTRAALAMCENIDWNVGRLMEKLNQLRLKENTIVVYMSDNGPSSSRWNGGMKGRKGSTDEGGVRSPLFLSWPGKIKAGTEITRLAAAIDLLPTLAELAGVDYKLAKALDGVSLRPLLLEEAGSWTDRFIFSHWNGRVSVRSQQYRLDHEGKLFNMKSDPGQLSDVTSDYPAEAKALREEAEAWRRSVFAELPKKDDRPLTVGHPAAIYTQLPARDGVGHGNITRSSRHPNCSFFTNWISLEDKITWDIEVLASGKFEVELYYTCPEKDAGSSFELTFAGSSLAGRILEGYDPPLRGMEHDRVERIESYVKDFKPLNLGVLSMEKGRGPLTIKAVNIAGKQLMDVRLLMLKRIE